LTEVSRAQQDYRRDVARGLIPPVPVWAGEGVDLITDVPSAGELVGALAAPAEAALARAAGA
jgi:nitronate monooxygenase